MVINNDLSLNTRNFTIKDQNYEIVGTRTGQYDGVKNAVDTVKNLNSGVIKEYTREKLKEMLIKFKVQ
jgi:hypothetical protein